MLVAMRNGQPDCVPGAPDMSNTIPSRLPGKPFWDTYLYRDPPLWMAYIEAVKHFGHDGWLAGLPCQLDCDLKEAAGQPAWQEAIVARTPDRIYTRLHARCGATVVVLGAVAAFLAGQEGFRTRQPTPSATLAVELVSALNIVAFFVCRWLGTRLFNAQFSPERLSRALHEEFRDPLGRPAAGPAAKCLAIVRKALLLRLCCLDVAAGFGFGACLVAIVMGLMQSHPICWLNGLPCVLLLLYVVLTFPTASRLKVLFLVKIAGVYRGRAS